MLRHSTAHLLAEAVRRLYPGVKIAIGPPIENGFYYDFEFPEPIHEADLERIEAEIGKELEEGRSWSREEISRDDARPASRRRTSRTRSSSSTRPRVRSRCTAGRLHRPLPRAAPAGLEADQGGQAHRARRCVLARRREEHAADPDLRDRLLHAGRPGRAPGRARGGADARPPRPRPAARSLPPRRHLARLAVLAPEGDGALEHPGGPASPREPEPRLRRGEDAADLRQVALGDLRPLGQVPREHVPDPGRRPDVRAQADELSWAHARVRQPAAELPRAPATLRRIVAAPPQRARGDAPRAHPRAPRHPGRFASLLHAGPDRGRGLRLHRLHRLPLRPLRPEYRFELSTRPEDSSAPTRSGTSPRARCARRSTAAGSTTS